MVWGQFWLLFIINCAAKSNKNINFKTLLQVNLLSFWFFPNSFFYLKVVSAIFYQIFFSLNDSPSKNVKNLFLFHLKSSFRSRNIQIFVFLSSPLFLPVSHCFRDWSNINLKVYDIINCLKKILIINFVLYLQKEKRYDIETLSIDIVLNKEHFCGTIIQKLCTKS